MGVGCREEGFGWVGEAGAGLGREGWGLEERLWGEGGMQQPAGQFSTGNWWPQHRGGVVERGGRGLRRSEGILGSASRQCGLALGSFGLSSPLRTAPVGHHKRHI